MAITRPKNTLTFAGGSVAAGGSEDSNSQNIDATAWRARVRLKAVNDGTAVAGDTMTFKIKYDTTTFDAETSGHAEELITIDTFVEDGVKDVLIDTTADSFVVEAINNAASNGITPSGEYVEQVQSS